jgi:hypothetical protein
MKYLYTASAENVKMIRKNRHPIAETKETL